MEAFATVKMIEDAGSRAWVFAEIAVAQARKGDVKQAGQTFGIALETAKTTEGAGSRALAFAEIAVSQARKGDVKQAGEIFGIALETTKMIEGADSRFPALVFAEIAAAQTKGGYFVEAFATVNMIEDTDDRARAFARIVSALAEPG